MSQDLVNYGQCTICGYVMLPILELSPCGHDGPVIAVPLEEDGVVYSWTRVTGGETDRIMVMADFLDGSLRVTAPLIDDRVPNVGDRVLLTTAAEWPYVLVLPTDAGTASSFAAGLRVGGSR